MSASKKSRKREQPSIKYRRIPVEGDFEVGEFVPKEYVPSLPDKSKKSRVKSETKPPEILSTAELISSLNQIWNCASNLTIFKQHSLPNRNHYVSWKEDILVNHYASWKEDILVNLGREENCKGSISTKYFCYNLRTASQLSPVKPSFKFVKISKSMSVFDSCEKHLNRSCNNGLSTLGFSCVYKFMRERIPSGQLYVNCSETDNKETGKYCVADSVSSDLGDCISADRTENLPVENHELHFHSFKFKDSSIFHDSKLVTDAKGSTSLSSDYFLRAVQETKANCSISRTEDSNLCADYHINILPSCNGTYKECQHLSDGDEQLRNERKQAQVVSTTDEIRMESHSTTREKHQSAFAKQEHAFAGAFAGIFVSLCLHPVDTVKTVVQSCHVEEKSIFYIGRSIISERGLTGLYRGIASNIVASAPISALYTFSYESVKGALLPLFPKEYHSLTHCIAGGCASIATSFIFTPSEHIKQQMQVGAHYRNCWNAFIGIIKRGGLPSLYTGWGAVLCRNVPHSIIKFYTYESLKQVMLTSLQSSSQLNTLQTLVCGGLAGSTAALFTTPFDVVKTRLQTQIPGSLSKYSSVYHALQDISMSEGLKGLYRGLIPRLVMYMSQGALFFASYEFLKQLFSLEVQQLTTHEQHKENEDYCSSQITTQSPAASTVS